MTGEAPTAPRKLSPEVRRSLARIHAGTASETDLQRVVIQYAKDHGWLVDHRGRAKVKEGRWVTPVWGHPGYVDLTLTRGGRLLLLELKGKDGSTSPEQDRWLHHLGKVGGPVHVGVYRPADWPALKRLLR